MTTPSVISLFLLFPYSSSAPVVYSCAQHDNEHCVVMGAQWEAEPIHAESV